MNLLEIRNKLIIGIPLTNINLRVTYYSRISTNHEEQQSSLKNQTTFFENMIKSTKKWKLVKGYIDKGITGTSDIKRENFMKMIEDAQKNKFDLIITKEISRFSRNTLDSIKYTRELLNYGVAVLFINDNINTAIPDSELRLTIMASLAQDEIRRLSERVKFGMHESIKKGHILGNNKLYGYKKDKESNKLIIIYQEAEIVQKIFTMYAINKISLNQIATILNSSKITTNRNKKWTPTTISRMIKNIKYKGYYCGKKTEIIDYITKKVKMNKESDWIVYKNINQIPPIVSETLWNKANTRLNKHKKTKRQSQKKYIYTSKIICKEHHTTFYRRKQCKSDTTWICSECLKNGKQNFNCPNIREKEINKIIKNILKDLDLSPIKKILLENYQKYNHQQENKKLVSIVEKKISLSTIYPILVSQIVSKIIVSNTENQIITVNIHLLHKMNLTPKSTFLFKRNNKSIKYKIILTYSI